MLPAAYLLAEPEVSGDAWMLNRFSACGGFCGDTWHPTLDDLLQQVEFEFEGRLSAWSAVPARANAHEFALQIRDQRETDLDAS